MNCKKTRFLTEDFALEHIKKYKRSKSKKNKVDLSTYLCDKCHSWHLTSSTSIADKHKREITRLNKALVKYKKDNKELLNMISYLKLEIQQYKIQSI